MEALRTSETSVYSETTRRYIPESSHLDIVGCKTGMVRLISLLHTHTHTRAHTHTSVINNVLLLLLLLLYLLPLLLRYWPFSCESAR
jgi:hypothetical protein